MASNNELQEQLDEQDKTISQACEILAGAYTPESTRAKSFWRSAEALDVLTGEAEEEEEEEEDEPEGNSCAAFHEFGLRQDFKARAAHHRQGEEVSRAKSRSRAEGLRVVRRTRKARRDAPRWE